MLADNTDLTLVARGGNEAERMMKSFAQDRAHREPTRGRQRNDKTCAQEFAATAFLSSRAWPVLAREAAQDSGGSS